MRCAVSSSSGASCAGPETHPETEEGKEETHMYLIRLDLFALNSLETGDTILHLSFRDRSQPSFLKPSKFLSPVVQTSQALSSDEEQNQPTQTVYKIIYKIIKNRTNVKNSCLRQNSETWME